MLMVMLLAALPDAKGVPPVHCSVVVYVAALAPPPKVSAGRVMVSPGNTLTWAPLVALGAVELNVALTAAGMGADARRLLDVVAVAVCPVAALTQFLDKFSSCPF